VASAKPTTIAPSASRYRATRPTAPRLGGWPPSALVITMATARTVSVIVGLEIDVTTRIHFGKRVLVTRKPFAARDVMPTFVPSEKKSQRNRPMMRFRR
jgi:hypothetical protein